MFLVKCPWCGWRDQTEFSYGGEAHIARPLEPGQISDQEWGDYIYTRTNTKGVHAERWVHTQACGRWFNALRHTVTDVMWDSYKMGEDAPTPPKDWDGLTCCDDHKKLAEGAKK